jgi:Fe-S-cluster-containing dehydrogenase component
MTRYGMVVDISKCAGCYCCFIACKDEHCGHDFPGYAAPQPTTGHFWMNLVEQERGQYPRVKTAYTAIPCMQCQEADCVKQARDGAVYRRPDGIVIIDPALAKGQRQVVDACPYRVIYWNDELDLPQKCTFCAHLLDDGWKEPRCVEMCPAGALTFGDFDDPVSEVARFVATAKTEVLHPEYGLKESVVYVNLPKKFIAGTVAWGDTDQCAVGVTVTASAEGREHVTQTDDFGDFEFEGLVDGQDYIVTFSAEGYRPQQLNVKLLRDTYLGVVALERQTTGQDHEGPQGV